jgi:hypothetical protein
VIAERTFLQLHIVFTAQHSSLPPHCPHSSSIPSCIPYLSRRSLPLLLITHRRVPLPMFLAAHPLRHPAPRCLLTFLVPRHLQPRFLGTCSPGSSALAARASHCPPPHVTTPHCPDQFCCPRTSPLITGHAASCLRSLPPASSSLLVDLHLPLYHYHIPSLLLCLMISPSICYASFRGFSATSPSIYLSTPHLFSDIACTDCV